MSGAIHGFYGLFLEYQLELYGYNSILGKDWEKRKIDEFMREDETRNRWE